MKTDSGDQRPSKLDTRKQKRFDNFLKQIEEELRNMYMELFFLRQTWSNITRFV